MTPISLPILLEDQSRFDWRWATYEPEVRVAPTRATVVHRLNEAPTLTRLVDTGAARWATELRCPKTLYCRVMEASNAVQVVEWDRPDVDGDVFVIPGLVAAADFVMRPGTDELTSIWARSSFKVPKGWWIARGVARRTRTLGQSLLKFHEDDNVGPGQMRIRRDQSAEELRFHVGLAKDIWMERTNRNLQIAALISALGQMAIAFPEPDDEPPVAREIRRRLEDAKIPVWDDHDNYDPARAATVIEPFHGPTEGGAAAANRRSRRIR